MNKQLLKRKLKQRRVVKNQTVVTHEGTQIMDIRNPLREDDGDIYGWAHFDPDGPGTMVRKYCHLFTKQVVWKVLGA